MTDRLSRALPAWELAIGREHVVRRADALDAAASATFETGARVLTVLRPGSREAVQDCARIATHFGIPIYPISSGRNWGYGSRSPVQDGVLLDLGRMNRILDYSEELAYVTIEPGVTQRQLHEYLVGRGGALWMDATGASPDCSIVGNTLERGFGHTPMGDHASAACGLEVVLPTGEIVETGFARFDHSKVGSLQPSGLGPSLDGLFLQSNFGIVTRMTVWLMPAPEHFEAFFFMTRREGDLPEIVDALRPLRLDGTLRSVMHIGNDYKVLAGSGQYPWTDTGGRTPLDLQTMSRIRKKMGIGHWNGSGGLYGTRAQVHEAKRRVRKALDGRVMRLHFLDDRRLRLLTRFSGMAARLTGWDVRRSLAVLEPVYGLLKGVPTAKMLASTYWRKRMTIPADPDPDRDRCGLLWCSPVMPNRGDDVALVSELSRSLLLGYGFEPQVSISLTTGRTAIAVVTIAYDRDVRGEDERALACYRQLTETLVARGYPPYRLNVSAMDLTAPTGAYGQLVNGLRRAVDPQGILAPGRYQPAPRAPRADVEARRGIGVA